VLTVPVETRLSDSSAAPGKVGRPTVGKPRQPKLLGDQLVAVDENQTARVERHRLMRIDARAIAKAVRRQRAA
jgi:hypothetical protein